MIGAAGMTSAFLYFYFRETGVQISWKDFVLSTQVDHLEVVNKQYVKVIPAHGVNSDVVSGMKMQFRPLVFIMLRSHKHDRRLNLKMLRRNNISSLCHFL